MRDNSHHLDTIVVLFFVGSCGPNRAALATTKGSAPEVIASLEKSLGFAIAAKTSTCTHLPKPGNRSSGGSNGTWVLQAFDLV